MNTFGLQDAMTAPIPLSDGTKDPTTTGNARPDGDRVTAARAGGTRARAGKGIGPFGSGRTAGQASMASASSAVTARPIPVKASPPAVVTPLSSSDAKVTEVINGGPPIAQSVEADKTEPPGAGLRDADDARTTEDDADDAATSDSGKRRKRKLAIVLGATVAVGLGATGIVWGLHGKDAGSSTPVGVLPVTGQTPSEPGGLVSGDQPGNPQPATSPQFGPNADPLPPPSTVPPPASLPPNPDASYPGLNTAPTGPMPKSPPGAPGLPPSAASPSDDSDDPSLSDTGLNDPSYGTASGPPYSFRPQNRFDARRYGSDGYRGQDRSDGPLGSLSEPNGGSRRGPVDDTVPSFGGLGH